MVCTSPHKKRKIKMQVSAYDGVGVYQLSISGIDSSLGEGRAAATNGTKHSDPGRWAYLTVISHLLFFFPGVSAGRFQKQVEIP